MSGLTRNRARTLTVAALAATAAFVGSAFVLASSGDAGTKAKTRVIYLSAVEWKGSAEVAKEPFPTSPLPAGGGYERFPPDASGKWSVETYRFDTGLVAACRGERVTLKIFGVNAPFHDITIPQFNRNFRVKRGELTTVSFAVKKTGIFPIVCVTHQPSHRADLVVLPC